MALSLFPFLAQGRALYIVLVYHTSSPEVSGSLLLLFGVGTVILITVLLMDEHASILPYLNKIAGRNDSPRFLPDTAVTAKSGGGGDVRSFDAISTAGGDADTFYQDANPMQPAQAVRQLRAELDEDLDRENKRAAAYVHMKLATAGGAAGAGAAEDLELAGTLSESDASRLAIVLHAMKFQFLGGGSLQAAHRLLLQSPADRAAEEAAAVWAVNGLSLALSLGECFGLLGPNGAGKHHLFVLFVFPVHYEWLNILIFLLFPS